MSPLEDASEMSLLEDAVKEVMRENPGLGSKNITKKVRQKGFSEGNREVKAAMKKIKNIRGFHNLNLDLDLLKLRKQSNM